MPPRTLVMWKPLLARSARGSLTLQGQVREMVVSAILDGLLPGGATLPSSRELATELALARNTVVLAYQQLADEGYLVSRQRSGHFVNPEILAGRVAGGGAAAAPSPHPAGAGPQWRERFRVQPTTQRHIVKPADWQQYPYPFLYGQFDASLFPTADWRECMQKAQSVLDIRDWAPDQITRDDEALVQQIRTRVLPRRGVWAGSDEIVVTVGAQHGLYLLADLFMHEGTRVGMEDPGYPDARNVIENRRAQLVNLPVDAQGLPPGPGLQGLDCLVVTPSHQCPTGSTMPLARREELLRLAAAYDFIVIEDDYEAENRFDGEPIPALKSLDRDGRVIYVGSLSKSLAPGLRIGYVVAPAPVAAELLELRRLMLRHPSALVQRAFALFLSLGHYDAHLRRLAVAQRERCAVLLQALGRHAPQVRVVPVQGGGSVWAQLPANVSAHALAERCYQRGVLVEPGDVFFANPVPPGNYVRLGYQAIAAAAIEPGIRVLAEVLQECQAAAV